MGGSESRFVIHRPDSTYTHRYVTQLPGHMKIGDATGYASRNIDNQYQKIVIKFSGKFAALRFDMHPQNYLGLVDGKLVMLGAWNASTQWKLFVFQKKTSSERDWSELSERDCSLDYDACKERTLQVALYSPEAKCLLQFVDGEDEPKALPIPAGYSSGEVTAAERAAFAAALGTTVWSLECVGSNVSADEGARAAKLPIVAVGGPPAGFDTFFSLEAHPAAVVVAAEGMLRRGKDEAAERLEHLWFDVGGYWLEAEQEAK